MCGAEYDPSFDFVDEIELLETLERYINIEKYCSICLYEIDDMIAEFVQAYTYKTGMKDEGK